MTDKIKTYVLYGDEEYPAGIIFRDRNEALEQAKEYRDDYGTKAYVRVKHFTREALEAIPEKD